MTANAPEVNPPLNDTQKVMLYAELATGAESGKFLFVAVFRETTEAFIKVGTILRDGSLMVIMMVHLEILGLAISLR